MTQDLRGVVEGNQLHVKAVGQQANFDKVMPWNPKVVGNLGELNLLKTRKPKPGDTFDYVIYEPIVNAIVTIRVKAEAYEVVRDRGGAAEAAAARGRAGQDRRRAAAQPDPLGRSGL